MWMQCAFFFLLCALYISVMGVYFSLNTKSSLSHLLLPLLPACVCVHDVREGFLPFIQESKGFLGAVAWQHIERKDLHTIFQNRRHENGSKVIFLSIQTCPKPVFFGQHFPIQDLKMKQLCPSFVGWKELSTCSFPCAEMQSTGCLCKMYSRTATASLVLLRARLSQKGSTSSSSACSPSPPNPLMAISSINK